MDAHLKHTKLEKGWIHNHCCPCVNTCDKEFDILSTLKEVKEAKCSPKLKANKNKGTRNFFK